MQDTAHGVDRLNALLRGEIAATETYQQGLAKVGSEPEAEELRRIHVEHRTAANILREQVHQLGGKPDQGSGTWGAWAKLVEGTAKPFGKTAALNALKKGEETGLKDYRKALDDANVPETTKNLIRTQLLPQTQEHIHTLDRIKASK